MSKEIELTGNQIGTFFAYEITSGNYNVIDTSNVFKNNGFENFLPNIPDQSSAFVRAINALAARGENPKARRVGGKIRQPLDAGHVVYFTRLILSDLNTAYRVNSGTKSQPKESMDYKNVITWDAKNSQILFETDYLKTEVLHEF